jgi:hypothetical protein
MEYREKPTRPWREIADEVTHERDPKKMITLVQELNLALEEQSKIMPTGESRLEKILPQETK